MKKNLLTLTVLGAFLSANGQILSYLDSNANVYVGKNALVYNGGGMKIKNNAQVLNYGNVMIVGSNTDVFKTVDASNVDKTETNGGGNFINKLNDPANYASVNSPSSPSIYTYGQLYISGLIQNNVTAIVDQEYRAVKHGAYQQISLPFFNKTFSTLSGTTEFNKLFTNTRWSQNEILKWNNRYARFDFVDNATKTLTANGANDKSTGYYILGSNGLDAANPATQLGGTQTAFTIKGIPYAEENVTDATIADAGKDINYGVNGASVNMYNERYNSYLQDGLHIASGGSAWDAADANGRGFGKNLYQYGNPFLTNLDLSRIGHTESATTGDGNDLSNIYGIRFETSGVQYTPNKGGGSTSYKFVVFAPQPGNSGGSQIGTPSTPVGDVDYLVVRPMSTFVIKMKDNTVSSTLNFKTLRRFNYLPRLASTNYSVTAARSAASKVTNTVKQLGVIALDANGNELGRTYYVVYANATTGYSNSVNSQVAASNNVIGTFEEAPIGGYDYNQTSKYWLYINEANENDFKGKNIKLVNYSSNIKSYRFEIRENAELVSDGTHTLSAGTGFYVRDAINNGQVIEAKQGGVVPATSTEFDLYYGLPTNGTLGTSDTKVPSRTKIVYSEDSKKYIVKFDSNWNNADIYVHDMSGKLIFSNKNVKTSSDYTINLDTKVNNTFIINVVSELGEKVTSKIIK